MSISSYGTGLIFCMLATIMATAGCFHAPSINLNDACTSASRSRRVIRTQETAASQQPCAALTTSRHCLTPPHRDGVGTLNAEAGGSGEEAFYTPADLEAYSKPWGITLHYRSTLNTYRIEAHRANGEVAGYTTGFYLGDLLHLDKVQIQRKESAYEPGAPNAPAPGTRDIPWAAKTGNLFQLGAVLGCAAVRYGFDRGARRVELLAIRDNEKQHSRLVRYYRIAGFQAVRQVGEDLGSLGDRLTWGAEGTLMAASAKEFMRRWTPLMLGTNTGGGGGGGGGSAAEASGAAAAVVEKQEA